MENTSSARTVSIDEAAAMTGLSKIAVQRRVDRGTLRAVVRDGRRRVPVSELRRAGLVDATGAPVSNTGGGPSTASTVSTPPGAAPVNTAAEIAAVSVLVERLEAQAGQLAEMRLLTAQAESRVAAEASAREAAEAALHETRAELTAAQARLRDLEERVPAEPAETPEPAQATAAAAPARRSWWPFGARKGHTGPDSAPRGPLEGRPARPAGLPPDAVGPGEVVVPLTAQDLRRIH